MESVSPGIEQQQGKACEQHEQAAPTAKEGKPTTVPPMHAPVKPPQVAPTDAPAATVKLPSVAALLSSEARPYKPRATRRPPRSGSCLIKRCSAHVRKNASLELTTCAKVPDRKRFNRIGSSVSFPPDAR